MPPRKAAGGGPTDDLFEAALQERLSQQAPLPARMRPRVLDEIVGQQHLLGQDAPLRALIESDRLSSIILWGPPGTGKTTLSTLVASTTNREFVALSAVTAGVKDVREVIEGARRRLAETGRGTILFLDEVHRFNKSQQDALLPAVEAGIVTLIGATTENPFFEVNAPLLSRSTVFRLYPLEPDELRVLVQRALDAEQSTAFDDAIDHLVDLADGDARAALTTLEVALALAHSSDPPRDNVTLADVERARQSRVLRYGEDEHYDVISAFIKSIRGSDPDAGLYWLARMLEAGEDARFIARRLVILASEDVGMADSMALVLADAAARAVEFVGLPEAALNLAHCVIYLSTAPKSNTAAAGIMRANQAVREFGNAPVPPQLRSTHPYQRNKLKERPDDPYRYSHNDPTGFIPQEFRPAEVAGAPVGDPARRLYYRPSRHGAEAEIGPRLREMWGDAPYDTEEAHEFKKFTDPSR